MRAGVGATRTEAQEGFNAAALSGSTSGLELLLSLAPGAGILSDAGNASTGPIMTSVSSLPLSSLIFRVVGAEIGGDARLSALLLLGRW